METKTKITDIMREALRGAFPDEAYKKHPTKTFLTTLKAMYITERLNDVFGIGRWTIDIEIIERPEDYVLVQGEFRSLDYEVIVPKQFGGHKTGGTNTEIADGFKSALTDCQSKIASYLEIGIEMFKGKIKVGGDNTQPKKKEKEVNKATSQEAVKLAEKCTTEVERGKIWNDNPHLHSDNAFHEAMVNAATRIKAQ